MGTGTPLYGDRAPTIGQYVVIAGSALLDNERTLTGTSNQIVVTDNGAGSTVVLSTPQDIHTGASPTFAGVTLTAAANISLTNTVAAGESLIDCHIIQGDDDALTGTLRGAYITASCGDEVATGTIRGIEMKARAGYPGETGANVNVLEGFSVSSDAKTYDVTTHRGGEIILDGGAGTSTLAVGLRIANNFQANRATTSYALEIYRDSFDYTADIYLSSGGLIGGASGHLKIDSSGWVGVGCVPTKRLDVQIVDDTAGVGFRVFNSDGSIDFHNGTGTANEFQPVMIGDSAGSSKGTYLIGRVIAGDDTGTTPVFWIDGRRTAGALQNRPVLAIGTYATVKFLVDKDGKTSLGTASMPTRQLDIRGTNDILVGTTVIDNTTAGLYWYSTTGYAIRREAGAWEATYPRLMITWNTGINIDTDGTFNITLGMAGGNVGVGTAPTGKLHVDQPSTTAAIPVLVLDQGDVSEQCIQFSSDATDRDIHLFTVNVTGAPAMDWLETPDIFSLNKGLDVSAGAISSATLTLSAAGPTDNLDVSGVNAVFINTVDNNVTLGGTVGGVDGQMLFIVVDDATNNFTIENEEGTGNQDFVLHAGADETMTAEHGGWIFVNHGGAHWHDASHAKHV